MKTSNLLLLALLAFVFISMIGYDLGLKKNFDRIDRTDPYYGFSHDTLPPFKYIKLTGKQFGMVQIRPGKTFEMRKQDVDHMWGDPGLEWKVVHDTLFIYHTLDTERYPYGNGYDFRSNTYLYIMAPALSGVQSDGVVANVRGWKSGEFSIRQSDKAILLTNNTFDQLNIEAHAGGFVEIKGNNQIGAATLQVRDSSTLIVEKDIFKSMEIQADSSAHINLPGSLLRRSLSL
ncbi:hypothetical protein [Salmonirosea aquatica]|uniref:Uncharacterized protein n=1 Tax=Salmonirosea aquatica TaxID=2654236 RepID=A0A7C9BB48_9BACT|nr:hypothetical protein [Cytophagaceae bacterium SJW1-29]